MFRFFRIWSRSASETSKQSIARIGGFVKVVENKFARNVEKSVVKSVAIFEECKEAELIACLASQNVKSLSTYVKNDKLSKVSPKFLISAYIEMAMNLKEHSSIGIVKATLNDKEFETAEMVVKALNSTEAIDKNIIFNVDRSLLLPRYVYKLIKRIEADHKCRPFFPYGRGLQLENVPVTFRGLYEKDYFYDKDIFTKCFSESNISDALSKERQIIIKIPVNAKSGNSLHIKKFFETGKATIKEFLLTKRCFNDVIRSDLQDFFVDNIIKLYLSEGINKKWFIEQALSANIQEYLFAHMHLQWSEFNFYDKIFLELSCLATINSFNKTFNTRILQKYVMNRLFGFEHFPFTPKICGKDSTALKKLCLAQLRSLFTKMNPPVFLEIAKKGFFQPTLYFELLTEGMDEFYCLNKNVPSESIPRPFDCVNGSFFILNGKMKDRMNDRYLCDHMYETFKRDHAAPYIDCLNRLSQTEWCLNDFMCDVMKHFYKNRSLLGVLRSNPFALETELRGVFTSTQSDMMESFMNIIQYYTGKSFWFHYHADYRGRLYPIAVQLTYYFEDFRRSLFQFANRKPLGNEGLKALKFHLYSTIERKRIVTEAEKLQFIDKNHDMYMETGKDPFNCTWWMNTMSPMQIVSICREYYNAHTIKDYKTGFPIKIDVRSDIFQHIAAMSRDGRLAKHTKLVNSECLDLNTMFYEKLKEIYPDSNIPFATAKTILLSSLFGASNPSISKYMESSEEKIYYNGARKIINGFLRENSTTAFNLFRLIRKYNMYHRQSSCSFIWKSPNGLLIFPGKWPLNDRDLTKYIKIIDFNKETNKYEYCGIALGSLSINKILPNILQTLDVAHLNRVVLSFPSCHSIATLHDCFWTTPDQAFELKKTIIKEFSNLHSDKLLEDLIDIFHQNIEYFGNGQIPNFKRLKMRCGDLELDESTMSDDFVKL